MLALLAALVATLAGLAAFTRRRALGLARESEARLPRGSDGIIVGASPIVLDGTRGQEAPAVLLLHGGGDTPQTLRYLAARLHERGYVVRAPLLPGHGRTPGAFARVRRDDWLEAARAELAAIRASHEWCAIVGLSMGGALAATLAAETRSLPALVLLSPYLAMPALIQAATIVSPLWGPVVPYVRASDTRARPSIRDVEERARSLAYGIFAPRALRALRYTMRRGIAALPHITAPTLMIQSRADNRISERAGARAFARIGAPEKQLMWIDDGAHVITVDRGRERVIDAVAGWLDVYRATASAARQHDLAI